MKQKISFFDGGLCRNLLRRFWPLWSSYLVLLIVSVPIAMLNRTRFEIWLNYPVLTNAMGWLFGSAAVGALAALCMFSFLYSSRSSGMIASLPVRRESVFTTAYLTGLVPLLAADALVMLLSAAVLLPTGKVGMPYLLQWLAIVAMGNTMFYSFACFCAVLTGNIIIMPIVYAVLNFAVFVAEAAVRQVLHLFVYGLGSYGTVLDFLSPVAFMMENLNVIRPQDWKLTGAATFEGWGVLTVYTAVSLLFAAAALFIYRRRHMESATDVVAVPILKPVFKYCLTFGCAVVFPCLITEMFYRFSFHGLPLALFLILLTLIGALIGYFGAEMLMKKTVRVFRGGWKGFAISALVLTALMLGCEFDAFGYERHIPDADEVESVFLDRAQVELTEPENIDDVIALHRTILENKQGNDAAVENYTSMSITYRLKNGRTVSRDWFIRDFTSYDAPNSELRQAQDIANSREAIRKRTELCDFTAADIEYFDISYLMTDGIKTWHEGYGGELTDAQVYELYTECMLPDILDGTLGSIWFVGDVNYMNTVSNVNISFSVELPETQIVTAGNPEAVPIPTRQWLDVTVPMNAERTMAWLRENTDISIMTVAEASTTEGDMIYEPELAW